MGEGVWRWGKREVMYLSLHCHHQADSCIKMRSDERHLNVYATQRLIPVFVPASWADCFHCLPEVLLFIYLFIF